MRLPWGDVAQCWVALSLNPTYELQILNIRLIPDGALRHDSNSSLQVQIIRAVTHPTILTQPTNYKFKISD